MATPLVAKASNSARRNKLSRIALSGNLSGTGTFTIASPDSNSDRTLNLPDAAGEMYNQGNILGTVSQSGGVPTGAIIERGSNANGEFVKYADGTMICTNNNIGVLTTTSAQGNVFRSTSTLSWTFPVAFSATPSLSASSSSAARWIGSNPDSTSGTFHLFFPTSNATNIDIAGLAIGRWF
jgi:hypothetical protein